MLDWVIVGWLGLVLIHGSRIPQLRHQWKVQTATGMSWWANLSVWLGLAAYLAYSIHIQDAVYMVSNSLGLVLQGAITYLNFIWRGRR